MKNIAIQSVKKVTDHKLFPILLFFIYFTMPFLLYHGLFSQDIIPINTDGINLMNLYSYTKFSLGNRELPLWNSLLSCGVPYAGDVSMAAFYPVRLLLLGLPVKWLWYVLYAFHLALGSTFFYKYLLEVNCNKLAALCTSILYLLSIQLGGFRKGHLQIIMCITYLPIILFFIERYFKELQLRYLLISSIFMAVLFFAGFPQYAFYTDIIAGIYIIVMGVRKRVNIKKWFKDALLWGISYIGLIAVQIIPFMEMTRFYSSNGSVGTSYEVFKSYSMHPIKLLMMIIPEAFREYIWQGVGYSEIDIEIFMGSIVFSVILFCMINYFKKFRVKLSIIVMACTFVYIMNGNFDILASVFYKVPLLNSFRVPSRALFIFLFFGFVLFSYGLTELVKVNDFRRFSNFLLFESAIVFSLAVFCISILCIIYNGSTAEISYDEIWTRFQMPIVILVVNSLVLKIFVRIKEVKPVLTGGIINYSVILLCTLLTIFEVLPYWLMHASYNAQDYDNASEAEKQLASGLGDHKVLLANSGIDGQYESIIKGNANITMGISAVNSYNSLNNPSLSKLLTPEGRVLPAYNFSGLYTGFPDIVKNLEFDNDILSMLGVKYIIDQNNYLNEQKVVVNGVEETDNNIFTAAQETIDANDNMTVISYPVVLDKNEIYEISFNCNAVSDTAIYFDLYADGYDNIEQDNYFLIKPSQKSYSAIVDSGEIPEETTETTLRLVVPRADSQLIFSDIKMKEVRPDIEREVYKLHYQDEKMQIYENKNCKDILYVPKKVEKIENTEELYYIKKWKYDFKDVSYVTEMDSFVTGETAIENVVHKSNKITAEINAVNDTFVNFSQAYYPGWKAYIDGDMVEISLVNGFIQGVRIPKGNHRLTIVYRPLSLYAGFIISGIVFVLMIFYIIKSRKEPVKKCS